MFTTKHRAACAGTLAPSAGPAEGARLMREARLVLASFPEVTVSVSQLGRPDDATDVTGFFNTEYFVDLMPKEQWRPVFHGDKDALIAAMERELDKLRGVLWNFSQPISDNMEEAVSGVKGELAIKVYGDDLKMLEHVGEAVVAAMRPINGIEDLGLFRVIGQPNLNLTVDRQQAARYGINVADIALRQPTLDDVFLTLTGHTTAFEADADAESLEASA